VPATRYVFFFANGKADGNKDMKAELGGKGAGLAEMTNAGLPVPPGFTIQTAACREYLLSGGQVPPEVDRQMHAALLRLEGSEGRKLGAGENPLLVSVRSGGQASMPGMMDTILNLGLNDKSVEALARHSHNTRFAYDSYRRLIQMFGSTVLEVPKQVFEEVFEAVKKHEHANVDTDLSADALKQIAEEYRKVIHKYAKREFPQDPWEQLIMARNAVFRSWNNDRARTYRRLNQIPDDLGTAVNVQCMVFGNMDQNSGSGVGFTRNPSTGAKEFYGEYLINAQGEDVVAGIRTPLSITELSQNMPAIYRQLREIAARLEHHYRDMQDFEFTIMEGRLFMLQTRNGKRTGRAAVRIAIDMVEEGLISKEEAIFRVDPNQLYDFLLPRLDDKHSKLHELTRGLPASPGAAVGQIVFCANEAVEKANHDKKTPVILVRTDTTPEDIHGMEVATGILTSRGGMTSHAAVVTRGMGKCCVVGAGELSVNDKKREIRVKGKVLKEGDWISLDGSTGRVFEGRLNTIPASADDPDLQKILSWSEPFRTMHVRANADIPRDAIQARAFGAEGIGLCRTEHMFFAQDRIEHMRAMILAETEEERRKALHKLLPMQRSDFVGVFRAMAGFPVTIRLLDPPLHEFLPRREDLMVEVALLEKTKPHSHKLPELHKLLTRVEELHEFNPMLGLRGCRLGIAYPEISEMQARAIFEAAVAVAKEGIQVHPEVMIPLVSGPKEMEHQKKVVHRIAEKVFEEKGARIDYTVGTMIEVPRAALIADDIAEVADFFSFGTNDLTQLTYAFSRDDINKFLPRYVQEGVLKQDPFGALDRKGVGQLVRLATHLGRKTNPKLKVGVCGEHGGEPSSVEFFFSAGLDYVSCSPFRVLTARLAAAQAAAKEKLGLEGGRTK
jgi:pyruvate,orthophosphate dikinase